MGNYRLDFLNDKEFELLVNDLVGHIFKVRVESFKAGKDQGIDGRFYRTKREKLTIIQAKHWEKTGLKQLLYHLETSEVEKIKRISPNSFIFGTSVPLSPADKDKIVAIFHPYIRRTDNIIGAEDIQSLLETFPAVVEKHYKLWFAGASVLRNLLAAPIIGRSKYTMEEIERELPRYVLTEAHKAAIKQLEKQKVLLISGEPGVGKTTLAKQLLRYYVKKGFQIVKIEDDISEAEQVFSTEKQVFYSDDFLGGNYLNVIEGRSDSRIVGFMQRVIATPEKRFILTSRTSILNRARLLSDPLSRISTANTTYELSVGNYSKLERAKIFYNHAWCNRLRPHQMDEIVKENRYLEVVHHPNFNPRIIEFITDSARIQNIPTKKYWAHIETQLENPAEIWRNTYEQQLGVHSRWLLRAIAFCGGFVLEREIADAFNRQFSSPSANEPAEASILLTQAIKESCGSVINRELHGPDRIPFLRLFNPSVGDYVIMRHAKEVEVVASIIKQLCLPEAISHLNSIYVNRIISESDFVLILEDVLGQNSEKLPPRFVLRAFRVVNHYEKSDQRKDSSIFRGFVEKCVTDWFSLGVLGSSEYAQALDLIALLTAAHNKGALVGRSSNVTQLAIMVLQKNLYKTDFEEFGVLISDLGDLCEEVVRVEFKKRCVDYLRDEIDELVNEEKKFTEYDDEDLASDANEAIRELVERYLKNYSISYSDSDIDAVAECFDVFELIRNNLRNRDDSYDDDYRSIAPVRDEIAEIHDLFTGSSLKSNSMARLV